MQSGEELAFVKGFSLSLAQIPVTLPDDYQPALEDVPKRVSIFPVEIQAPPQAKQPSTAAVTSSSGISVTIKSTKPPLSFPLTVQLTDTIAQIKAQLAQEHLNAPTADNQRLLLKGKILTDTKLLKEYDIAPDTVITLMTKPGSTWTGEKRAASMDVVMSEPEATVIASPSIVSPVPVVSDKIQGARLGSKPFSHQRSLSGAADEMPVPSVVLSPTPSNDQQASTSSPIALKLDTDLNTQPDPPRTRTPNAYHNIISDPAFWNRLLTFLNTEFKTADDAQAAWEGFFLASKGHMTAHEIAKIRDQVGVVAMAGH